jgi:hypothetical protein
MKKLQVILAFLTVNSLILTSCKKENPETPPPPANEAELITTFKIVFTDPNGVNPTYEAVFRDIDGAGGNQPTAFDTIRLKPNSTYNASIQFLNESVLPADTITNEILQEAGDHLICYNINGANVSVQRTDSDGVFEIGLLSNWTTLNVSTGNVIITLKHQPGIKNGNCDLGDTDIELNFITRIE